jgi:hypothetical protein
MSEIKKIALIDADSILYYSALQASQEITLEECQNDAENRIYSMVDGCGADAYILCMSESKTFRNKLSQIRPYKGNRKDTKKPPRFYGLKEYLKQQSCILTDLEADDAVAILRHYIKKHYPEISTTICSPDKDVLRQLSGVHYDYNKSIVVETTPEEAYRFLCKQLIMGDSTDNIQGVPGVGEVKSEAFLLNIQGSHDYIPSIIRLYQEKFGFPNCFVNFTENLRLLYILRNEDDLKRESPELYNSFSNKEQFDALLFNTEEGVLHSLKTF